MKKVPIMSALLISVFVFILFLPASHAVQIIIINETEEFAPANLEKMVISGDLFEGMLYFSAEGYAAETGGKAKVYIAGKPSDILVESVTINGNEGKVFFDERGYFVVVDTPSFHLEGRIKVRSGDNILFFPGPINKLEFRLKHGYAINGPEFYGVVNKTITLKKTFVERYISVTGSGKITVESTNTVRFKYVFEVAGYGGVIGTLSIPLNNGELVNIIDVDNCAGSSWNKNEEGITFQLPCEKAIITLEGVFSCGECNSIRFTNPIDSYMKVIVEAVPEKKLTIRTYATELDVSEAPFPMQYPNGRVFLLSGHQAMTIEVEELEKLPALAATIDRAKCTQAINKDGAALTSCEYRYKNSGMDFIKFELEGTPLYAEANDKSLRLTVEDDDLYLAFPKSRYGGDMEIMYFTSMSRILPIDLISLPIPSTEVPTTEMAVDVYLPKDVYVLAAFGGDRFTSELPALEFVVAFTIAVLLVGLALWNDKRKLLMFYVVSAAIYFISQQLFLIWLAICLLPFVKRNLPTEEIKKTWRVIKFLLATGIVIAALFFVISWLFSGTGSYMAAKQEAAVYKATGERFIGNMPVVEEKSVQLGEEGKGTITIQLKEGIKPVKMEIPQLGKVVSLHRALVTAERPASFKLVVIDRLVIYMLLLVALYFFLKLLPDLKKAYIDAFPSLRKIR